MRRQQPGARGTERVRPEGGAGTGRMRPEGNGTGTGRMRPEGNGVGAGRMRPEGSNAGTGRMRAEGNGAGTGRMRPEGNGAGAGRMRAEGSSAGAGRMRAEGSSTRAGGMRQTSGRTGSADFRQGTQDLQIMARERRGTVRNVQTGTRRQQTGSFATGRERTTYAGSPGGRTSGNAGTAKAAAERAGTGRSGAVKARTGRRVPVYASDSKNRARAEARRRRKKRMRWIMIGIFALIIALAGCGIVMGIRHFGTDRTRSTLRKDGITALEDGDYKAAVEKFDEALKLSGNKTGKFEIDVLQYRADANYNLKDYTASLEDWKKLIELDGENVKYKENAVLCMLENGDYDGALAVGVLQSRVYNRRAVMEIENQEFDQALETIRQGMAVDDGSRAADLLFNQVVAYEGKHDFKEALRLLNSYIATYGTDENVQRELTFLESRQGNSVQAGPEDGDGTELSTGEGETGTSPENEGEADVSSAGNSETRTSSSGNSETRASSAAENAA